MVDPETRLDVTVVAGATLIYKYTLINAVVAEMDTLYFHQEVEKRTVESYCTMENMREMLIDGVQCRYMYFDRNRAFVTNFLITEDSCVEYDKKH